MLTIVEITSSSPTQDTELRRTLKMVWSLIERARYHVLRFSMWYRNAVIQEATEREKYDWQSASF